MIPKAIIEKAMEGGWEDTRPKIEPTDEHNAHYGGILTDVCTNTLWWPRIALDKTFWQALGKVLGWTKYVWISYPPHGYGDLSRTEFTNEETWHPDTLGEWPYAQRDITSHWHAKQLYDLILTGGDTEKFWEELLGGELSN